MRLRRRLFKAFGKSKFKGAFRSKRLNKKPAKVLEKELKEGYEEMAEESLKTVEEWRHT